MTVREVVGVLSAIIILAGLSNAIVHGGQTAAALAAGADGFANMIRAATLRG